ncbi:MAG: 1-acyl-sn-glycerol-3-phosphate acyltransferase [Bacteroidales bacterium]|nr:1-acyl-sn-glycerol-3-phosphate acyltransferase [Bacteroidales bacterium]
MFDDIRPYTDAEIPAAMQRIVTYPEFRAVSGYLFPEKPFERVAETVVSCRTIDEFQDRFMVPVVESIMALSTDGVTVEGMEKLDPDRRYLFVANHRDITLDATFFQVLLRRAGLRTTEITFGANLMQGGLVVDFGKSNKMFRVERPTTVSSPRAFLTSSVRLSEYIRWTILEKRESVWIAQRNGRTKDGVDATDQGIIKMFSLAGDILDLSIVPLAVSYEWEPCDVLKAAELTALERDRYYEKKPGEDLKSILTGITQPKGRVHYTVCDPVTAKDLAPWQDLPVNTFCRETAALIDRRIRAGYRIWPNNRIAADYMEGTSSGGYTPREKAAFEAHLSSIPEELRPVVRKIYAGPLL